MIALIVDGHELCALLSGNPQKGEPSTLCRPAVLNKGTVSLLSSVVLG